MNKELKKAIEVELHALISAALTVRNKAAAADLTKTIKDHVKVIAKKFVKNLPKTAVVKTDKKVTKVSKVATKPSKSTQTTTGKVKRTKVKK